MANEEHLAILKKGAAAWNEWRAQHLDIRPNLRGADLTGANLVRTDLSRAELSRSDLSRANVRAANLVGADLYYANLYGADFSGADLTGANLSVTNLSRSNLSRAKLNGTNLTGAKTSETDFSEATLAVTVFADVDLGTAKGLETVRHAGPSTIGVDTIYNSQGKIPEVFLRGAGLPDDFIGYVKSIAGAIQFYSCFISYSGKDQDFADRLYEGLQNKGVRCWFAPHDVKAGEKLHEQIDAAIRMHDKLLLILSEHSMNSEWVKTEIAKARKRELKEGKRVLFPVRLVEFETLRDWECFDGDTGKDSAREIREYFIPDFANWKDHDSYQNGFDRLLKDLKSPDAGAKPVATAKD
jgi:hypothetical protein